MGVALCRADAGCGGIAGAAQSKGAGGTPPAPFSLVGPPRSGAGAADLARRWRRQAQAEDGARRRARDERQVAAMGAHQLARDRQAESGAAGSGRAKKRAEQIVPRLGRQTRAVIGNLDDGRLAFPYRRDPQPVGAGFDRVARQVREDAVELVAVGLDLEPGRNGAVDREVVLAELQPDGDLVDQCREPKPARRPAAPILRAKNRACGCTTRRRGRSRPSAAAGYGAPRVPRSSSSRR